MPQAAIRSLIVVSEFIIALDLQWTLDHLGVEVCGLARDAEAGLKMASELSPDVVLIDVYFDLQGIELAKELRDVYSTPVIFVGAYISGRIATQIGQEVPGAPVLQRPVSCQDLAQAIGTVTGSRNREQHH
jgi:DNA-binding NarL/FixJ family response regulator